MRSEQPASQQLGASSPIPLYHQVSRVLRQRIVSGTYPLGSRLAAEAELAAEFGVARATIRQAVGELVTSGLVSREQGRGTFVLGVAHKKFGVTFRGELSDLINAAAANASEVHDLAIERRAQLPPDVAHGLNLDSQVGTIVQRTLLTSGTPFAYHVNYLPERYGSLLHRGELLHSGVISILARAGVAISRARQTIAAQSSEPEESEKLGVALGSAVLVSERWLYNSDGEPVELNRAWYPGDIYEYVVELSRNISDNPEP